MDNVLTQHSHGRGLNLGEPLVARLMQEHRDELGVEQAIFDTLYEERRRLEDHPEGPEKRAQLDFYNEIYQAAIKAGPHTRRLLLQRLVESFAQEITGHFDPKVYAVVTRLVPPLLSVLLNAMSPTKLLRAARRGFDGLGDRVRLSGQVDELVELSERGTVVLVPTHSSNLDSVVLGFAIYKLGLPPFLYGAGLNLFSHPIFGHFIENLGAYKVDRRKQAKLYKKTLKTYTGLTLEHHLHNLFFPGGTRSRSNLIESKLKLGLLGQCIDAYRRNLLSGSEQPDIFVIPCTINYKLVLEAESLISEYLRILGKSHYIAAKDDFDNPKRVLQFFRGLFAMDANIDLVFGQALDLFGNQVDISGRSFDQRGREVDRRLYLKSHGVIVEDPQRDMEYTRVLEGKIAQAYRQDTIISEVNLLTWVIFDWLQEHNPTLDLFRLIRTGGKFDSILLSEVYERIEEKLESLQQQRAQGLTRLSQSLDFKAPEIVKRALFHLGSYHTRACVETRGHRLFHIDRELIYFYANRMAHLDSRQPRRHP